MQTFFRQRKGSLFSATSRVTSVRFMYSDISEYILAITPYLPQVTEESYGHIPLPRGNRCHLNCYIQNR